MQTNQEKPSDPKVPNYVRIPRSLMDKIDEIRGPEKRTRAAQINLMLERYIQDHYEEQ